MNAVKERRTGVDQGGDETDAQESFNGHQQHQGKGLPS
jgi:hypothetical protein